MSLINKFKKLIKNNKVIFNVYEALFQRKITNLYKRSYSKKVLYSYSTYHFKVSNYSAHSNYQESQIIAKMFDSMGYQIDVVNNNKLANLDFTQYDIVFGEGLPVLQANQAYPKPLVIYYGTGSHPFQCNAMSYKRLISHFNKTKFLAKDSIRISVPDWGIAASTSEAVICIGNATTRQTFLDNGCTNVYALDPSFHQRQDALVLSKNKNYALTHKTLLWFGSYGLLHKGLDLAVEAVKIKKDWTLHICGYTPTEKDFLQSLNLPNNVIVHGFIDVYSDSFKHIANQCGFVILPSCSEGIATAVITAVANGAMLPIVSKECGYDVVDQNFIIELTAQSIVEKLCYVESLETKYLIDLAKLEQEKALERYSVEKYAFNIENYVNKIIKDNKKNEAIS